MEGESDWSRLFASRPQSTKTEELEPQPEVENDAEENEDAGLEEPGRLRTFLKEIPFFETSKSVHEKMKDQLEFWETEEAHVAVIGKSKMGRTTFINALLGLKRSYPGKPKKDLVTSEQIEPKIYNHPGNPNVQFWEFPAGEKSKKGTPIYQEVIEQEVTKFDLFIVVTKDEIYEEVAYCLELCEKIGRRTILVRTHIDEDDRSEGESKDQIKTTDSIRSKLENQLSELQPNSELHTVILVNSLQTNSYDFPFLHEVLVDKCAEHKRTLMALSHHDIRSSTNARKYEILLGRALTLAAMSGYVGIGSLPGFGSAVKLQDVVSEVALYLRTFSLFKKDLKKLEKIHKLEAGSVGSFVDNLFVQANDNMLMIIRNGLSDLTHSTPLDIVSTKVSKFVETSRDKLEFEVRLLRGFWVTESTLRFANLVMPSGFSSGCSGALFYGTTFILLKKTLNTIRKIATDTCDYIEKCVEEKKQVQQLAS